MHIALATPPPPGFEYDVDDNRQQQRCEVIRRAVGEQGRKQVGLCDAAAEQRRRPLPARCVRGDGSSLRRRRLAGRRLSSEVVEALFQQDEQDRGDSEPFGARQRKLHPPPATATAVRRSAEQFPGTTVAECAGRRSPTSAASMSAPGMRRLVAPIANPPATRRARGEIRRNCARRRRWVFRVRLRSPASISARNRRGDRRNG
jgi:hypothetical protein